MKKYFRFKFIWPVLSIFALFTACDAIKEDVLPSHLQTLQLQDDYFTVIKNQPLQFDVFKNDSVSSAASVNFGQPQHGSILAGSGSSVMYQPKQNYVGTDTLIYNTCIGNNCASAKVIFSVVNDSSACIITALNDSTILKQGQQVTVNVLQNDTPCAGILSFAQNPAHGTASISNNQITYIPNPNFIGSDHLLYKISGHQSFSIAKLTLKIIPDSATLCQILATNDQISFKQNRSVTVNILANDNACGAPALLVSGHGPAHGQAFINNSQQLIYTPANGFVGSDHLKYQLAKNGVIKMATVSFNVLPDSAIFCAVRASDDYKVVGQNTQGNNISVLQNDNFCMGGIGITQQPMHGTAYFNGNHVLQYTPHPNYSGPDEIKYRIMAYGQVASARVYITVLPNTQVCNQNAIDDAVTMAHTPNYTDSVTINVLANDIICPNAGSSPNIQISSQPYFGTVTITGTGLNRRFIYVTNYPATNFTDTFQYQLCQGNNCDFATVTVYVQ